MEKLTFIGDVSGGDVFGSSTWDANVPKNDAGDVFGNGIVFWSRSGGADVKAERRNPDSASPWSMSIKLLK